MHPADAQVPGKGYGAGDVQIGSVNVPLWGTMPIYWEVITDETSIGSKNVDLKSPSVDHVENGPPAMKVPKEVCQDRPGCEVVSRNLGTDPAKCGFN